MFVRDCLLSLFDEAIRPGMPGLRASVAQDLQGTLELVAAVGEHALDRPPDLATGSRVVRRSAAAAWCVSAGRMVAAP